MIDQDQDIDWNENTSSTRNSIGNHKIVELRGKFILKGLVPLEILFAKDDTLLKPTLQSTEENFLICNIGLKLSLKWLKYIRDFHERKGTGKLNYLNNLLIFLLGHMKIWK